MMRGVTASCLLLLICYIVAPAEGSASTTEGTLATETSLVTSTSITLLVKDSATTSSNSPTSVGPLTSQTTKLPFTSSNQSLANGSTISTSSSGPEGASVSSTHVIPNTSLSTSSSLISTSSSTEKNVSTTEMQTSLSTSSSLISTSSSTEKNVSTTEMQTSLSTSSSLISTSSSTEKNVSTTEMQTSLSNATSSPVNNSGTILSAPTSQMPTEMPTNTTVNVTQTSTLQHTTIASTPKNNASTSIPAASGDTNITVSTAISTNETSTVVTPNITSNITLTSTSATTEGNTNVTMLVNVTMPTTDAMPTNGTSEMMSWSTEVFNSSWSTTQPPQTSTTRPADQCANAICPPGSECVNLFQSYDCQCPPGLSNQANSCVRVRSFPGVLHLKHVNFTDGMNEMNSKVFFDTAKEIEKEVKGFFKNDRFYYKSVVQKLEKGSVNAFIDNVFALSSNATEESVITSIKSGIKDCVSCKLVSRSDSYRGESICSLNYCDSSTSECKANNGRATCNCLPGYYKFSPFDQGCRACLSGLKLENGACVKCPFGYGGFNCDKSYLLAVVVISCVLGGVLLLLLLALIAICLRSKSGKCSSSTGSHDYVMWPKSEMPKIPRATMHWDGNQLEMQENGSTSSLTDIHRDGGRTPEKNDDLKTFKGKQQSRYTYLCQGQENPYYVSDEKKPEYL